MVDSDFENLSLLCDRIVVMHDGHIATQLTGPDEATEAIARAVFLANPSLSAHLARDELVASPAGAIS